MLKNVSVSCGVGLVFLLLLAAACVAVPGPGATAQPPVTALPSPEDVPAAPVATSEPMTVTEDTLTLLVSNEFAASHMRMSDAQQFPLAPAAYEMSADALLVSLEDGFGAMQGSPRAALGRVVADELVAPEAGAAITWVLFTAYPAPAASLAWEETSKEKGLDGVWRTVLIARQAAATDVLTFTWTTEPLAAMTALLDARDAYAARTGLRIWIDEMLVEEPDGLGGSRWRLYVFTNSPGGGSDPQYRRYLCCKVLQCGGASDIFGQANCWLRCRGISC